LGWKDHPTLAMTLFLSYAASMVLQDMSLTTYTVVASKEQILIGMGD